MQKVTIRLTDDQAARLELAARQQCRSKSSIIREMLDEYFACQRNDFPSIFGTWSAGNISGAESEEWLRENWNPGT